MSDTDNIDAQDIENLDTSSPDNFRLADLRQWQWNHWGTAIFVAPFAYVFVMQMLATRREARAMFYDFALVPAQIWRYFAQFDFFNVVQQLVGHGFLHGAVYNKSLVVFHFSMNLTFMAVLCFWLMSFLQTRQRHPINHRTKIKHAFDRLAAMVLFFVFTTLFAGLVVAGINAASWVKIVGASGGGSAMLGAYMRLPQLYVPYLSDRFTDGTAHPDTGLRHLFHPIVIIMTILFVLINIGSYWFFLVMSQGRIIYQWDIHLVGYGIGILLFPYFTNWVRHAS